MADECQAMAYTSCNSVQPVSAPFPRGLDSINFDLRAQCARAAKTAPGERSTDQNSQAVTRLGPSPTALTDYSWQVTVGLFSIAPQGICVPMQMPESVSSRARRRALGVRVRAVLLPVDSFLAIIFRWL